MTSSSRHTVSRGSGDTIDSSLKRMTSSVHQTETTTAAPVAPEPMRERVRGVLQSLGVRGAERALGVSRTTLLAVAAGAPVRAGSIALVREYFASQDKAAATSAA